MRLSATPSFRVKRHKRINGNDVMVTVMRSAVVGNIAQATVMRTTDGEQADLQLRYIMRKSGKVEFLHIHCLKDKQSTEWRKESGLPSEKFYEISQDDTWFIVCKRCKRTWNSSGLMKTN
jgi:cell division inhibitor SulA